MSAKVKPAMVHRPGCAKPDAVTLCACGANVTCRTCHWGSGSWPCACRPAPAERELRDWPRCNDGSYLKIPRPAEHEQGHR